MKLVGVRLFTYISVLPIIKIVLLAVYLGREVNSFFSAPN